MEYKVTWLDAECGMLGESFFGGEVGPGGDELDLEGVVQRIIQLLDEKPNYGSFRNDSFIEDFSWEDVVQFNVELYDQ